MTAQTAQTAQPQEPPEDKSFSKSAFMQGLGFMPEFGKQSLLKDKTSNAPQYFINSYLTLTDKDKNLAPVISFELEGVTAQDAVKYNVGGLLKFMNPLAGNSNKENLENYLSYIKWLEGQNVSRIYRDGEYRDISLERGKVEDELDKARNAENLFQSHILGGSIKAGKSVGTCKVSLYLDAFSQGGTDYKDKNVFRGGLIVAAGNGEIYISRRFSEDKYQSFNGVDLGEGPATEAGGQYTIKFNKGAADFELGAKLFVLNDENGNHVGIAVPVIATDVDLLGVTLAGGVTPTGLQDYEPVIVGQFEASKEAFGKRFVVFMAGNNKGDVEITSAITTPDSKKGFLIKASRVSPDANIAQGGLPGTGWGAGYYSKLSDILGFFLGFDRYKDVKNDWVTVVKGGVDFAFSDKRKTAEDYDSDLRLKSVQLTQEDLKKEDMEKQQKEKIAPPEPPKEIKGTAAAGTYTLAQEKDKRFKAVDTKIKKDFTVDAINSAIKGRFINEFKKGLMKTADLKKGSADEGYIDTLIGLFTEKTEFSDGAPVLDQAQKAALRSKYGAMFGAQYYKYLLAEITDALTIDTYEDICELYKIFVNGSLEEEGLDKSVIEATAKLDELRRGNHASEKDITTALNRLKSRIIQVPPEKFHWQYIDLLHDRMNWVDFDIRGASRYRPEDVRRFFETTKLLNNGKPVKIDIAGRTAECTVYKVDYKMLTQDELNLKGPATPQTGTRYEYYEYDAASKMQRKVMTVEDYDDTWVLHRDVRYKFGLKFQVPLDQPPTDKHKVSFQLKTYHYYIEGTNIERSYQKEIIWKSDCAFMGKEKGDSEIVEMGVLRLTGDERYLDERGNMEMSVWLTFEPMRNVRAWREQLKTIGPSEELLANTLASIPKGEGKLILVHSYIDYTKNMDPYGADEVFKKGDKRLKDEKISTIVAVYIEDHEIVGAYVKKLKAGDKVLYPSRTVHTKAFTIPKADPDDAISYMEAVLFDEFVKSPDKAKEIKVRADETITSKGAVTQRNSTINSATKLSPTYPGADGWLGNVQFLFSISTDIITSVLNGDKERARELIDFCEKAKRSKGLLHTAYNVENGDAEELGNLDVIGPHIWCELAKARFIEKFGDLDGSMLKSIVKTVDSLLKLSKKYY
ncbi:MAG: hypothetical protein KKD11_08255, partial [Candidatus Omnitrophica bacterium]|nr:hypothetical protein [Candidatus Omnitrophota bacterium]